MNIAAIVLLASLLCAECPACSMEERWLIAQTVIYRAKAKSLSIDEVIYEPHQYAGVELINLPAYMKVRRRELEENIRIAALAIFIGHPTIKVGHFARTGTCRYDRPCEWESHCDVVSQQGTHTFYLCPEGEKRRRFKEYLDSLDILHERR